MTDVIMTGGIDVTISPLISKYWVVMSILCPSSSSNVDMLAAGELIVGAVIVCLRQENALWI